MNKKTFFIIIVLVAVLLAGGILCYRTFVLNNQPETEGNIPPIEAEIQKAEDDLPGEKDKAAEKTAEDTTYVEVENNDVFEIPIDSVVGITAKDAEKLCYDVMGERDEKTGFPFSFGTTGAVEKCGKQYYTIRASWLVNNSHMSYIGDFFVSADGDEIYTGEVRPGEYTMTSVIWSK